MTHLVVPHGCASWLCLIVEMEPEGTAVQRPVDQLQLDELVRFNCILKHSLVLYSMRNFLKYFLKAKVYLRVGTIGGLVGLKPPIEHASHPSESGTLLFRDVDFRHSQIVMRIILLDLKFHNWNGSYNSLPQLS